MAHESNSQNPLFMKWLKEMKEEAAAKPKKNMMLIHSYEKAMRSLEAYPIKLQTGQDCFPLKHFGKKICKLLDDKLEEFTMYEELRKMSSNNNDKLGGKGDNIGGKRGVKRAHESSCPNPLFLKWLKEKENSSKGIIAQVFEKAIVSLEKCPIKLATGKDCLILKHFGKKTCDYLDQKLKEYENLDDEDEDAHVGKRAKKNTAAD